MFGYTIINKEELAELEQCREVMYRMQIAYRWFGEWEDLDILWDYLYNGEFYISHYRDEYAKTRMSNEITKSIS